MRVSRTDGTTTYTYVYNGSQLTQMSAHGETMRFTYDEAGNPMILTHDGVEYYYVTNLQGDVTSIVDTNGYPVATYSYDPWGKILSYTTAGDGFIACVNPLLYRGYVYDWDTELYYLQSRYYDPSLRRFLNADALATTGQGIIGNNMFAYCLNNPVNCEDNEGTRCMNVGADLMGGARERDVTDEIFEVLNTTAEEARARVIIAEFNYRNNPLCAKVFIYFEFYNLVNHKAPWDIKRSMPWAETIGTLYPGVGREVKFMGNTMTPEDLGNFTYGYLGYAYGIPLDHLLGGSYYAAGFPIKGEPMVHEIKTDWNNIMMGYMVATLMLEKGR